MAKIIPQETILKKYFITRTLPIIVELPEDQNLPPAYEMVGLPLAQPDQVEISGGPAGRKGSPGANHHFAE